MTVYLRAHAVTLELPLDMQRVDEGTALTGLRATMGGASRHYRSVLKDISFSAEEGDRIGVIGFNGAGKTTLLRVLNGAFAPTHGRVDRKGSMQSLINATLGFSEYASVMENVILRGTAMGLRRRQIEGALAGILDFAGLTDQAMHRLHTLSSGQRMRLGFAISTAIQPDILLMDEWIATGDAAFIKRAQARLRARFNESRIVVLASHSTSLLRETCNKGLLLNEGRLAYFGDIKEALGVYADTVARAGSTVYADMAASDPLLFGDALGTIERIKVASGFIEVEGWAMESNRSPARKLCIELDGALVSRANFDRVDRQDVRDHLAKNTGAYGFRIRLTEFDGAAEDVVARLKLGVDNSDGRLGVPLPVARGAIVERVE